MGRGTWLAVQCFKPHASNAGGPGLIPGQGAKIPHAVQHGQKKEKKEKKFNSNQKRKKQTTELFVNFNKKKRPL